MKMDFISKKSIIFFTFLGYFFFLSHNFAFSYDPELLKKDIKPGQVVRLERMIEIFMGEDIQDFAMILPLPPETDNQKILRLVISPDPSEIVKIGQQRYALYRQELKRLNYISMRYFADIQLIKPLLLKADTLNIPLKDGEIETEQEIKQLYLWKDVGLIPDSFFQGLLHSDGNTGDTGDIGDKNHQESGENAADQGLSNFFQEGVKKLRNSVKTANKCYFYSPSQLLEKKEGSRIEKGIFMASLLGKKGIASRLAFGLDKNWIQIYFPHFGWVDGDQENGNLSLSGQPIIELISGKRPWAPGEWASGPAFLLDGKWYGPFRSTNFYFSDSVRLK